MTLQNAIEAAMTNWIEDGEFRPHNPAIVCDRETGEFDYTSSLLGGYVVLDLAQYGFCSWDPESMDEVEENAEGMARDLMLELMGRWEEEDTREREQEEFKAAMEAQYSEIITQKEEVSK